MPNYGLKIDNCDLKPTESWGSVFASVSVVFLIVVVFSWMLSLVETQIFAVHEARAAEWEAVKMIETAKTLTMRPGETKEFTVGFKNTGSNTWTNTEKNYISIYTWSPKYRTSRFQDTTWKLREQPAAMKDSRVAPGQVGYVVFKLRAPADIASGVYEEKFYLAAEDLLWIPGGEFTVSILIDTSGSTTPISTPVATSIPTPTAASIPTASAGYEAKLLLRSHQQITMRAGEAIKFTAGFKNYGRATWLSAKIVLPDVAAASTGLDNFYDISWKSRSVLAESASPTAPGALQFFTFTLKAASAGVYQVNLKLQTDGTDISGGELDIPITVTDDSGDIPSEGTSPAPTIGLMQESLMRIGLYDLEGDLTLTADKSFVVKTSCGQDLGTYAAGVVVTASYNKSTYQYSFFKDAKNYTGACYLRFEPAGAGQNIFELTSLEQRPAWNRAYNDNRFRGVIELRVSETNYPWVINELPMEDYLKGLAETSNYSPTEFQKALVTAARSYAYFHYSYPTKHAKGHFILDATYDQVYRGYGNEIRVPRLANAVEQTRGMIVHYDNEPVFTPYYSRSDGRTRSYKEVWGGSNGIDYGWLQSVPAPYDAAANNTLWGHGVGMACTDAIGMANAGRGWDEIVKYYYSGIVLKKLW
ncbi:MAG: SpoIID/LytB domain-containing protein [Patescibacteria group bacterium]|nr:SpoIID/LytB domain-containing protein [Patescibacteria group bacterium]